MDEERLGPAPRPAEPAVNPLERPPLTQEASGYEDVTRTNRRRLALLGLATGAVMALIVLACLLLFVLLIAD